AVLVDCVAAPDEEDADAAEVAAPAAVGVPDAVELPDPLPQAARSAAHSSAAMITSRRGRMTGTQR
ncbi:MAG TPA: hypothetical protein VE127_00415, partial [Solirubrobacteraceae bacterium]|nr:hypothetical protein [Solirubrobacteraceae bacterium]